MFWHYAMALGAVMAHWGKYLCIWQHPSEFPQLQVRNSCLESRSRSNPLKIAPAIIYNLYLANVLASIEMAGLREESRGSEAWRMLRLYCLWN